MFISVLIFFVNRYQYWYRYWPLKYHIFILSDYRYLTGVISHKLETFTASMVQVIFTLLPAIFMYIQFTVIYGTRKTQVGVRPLQERRYRYEDFCVILFYFDFFLSGDQCFGAALPLCGSGSSFLSECRSGSGSSFENECRSR
jgi:hypothetical protein